MQIFAEKQMLKHDTKLLETRMNIIRIHNRYIENHKTMFSVKYVKYCNKLVKKSITFVYLQVFFLINFITFINIFKYKLTHLNKNKIFGARFKYAESITLDINMMDRRMKTIGFIPQINKK